MSYCDWDKASDLCRLYHDEEWGVPVHDDKKQFEFLMLEAMQCGLSWNLMIQKREIFRKCFDDFDYDKIALYTEADVDRILNTDGMIRSPPQSLRRYQQRAVFSKNQGGIRFFLRLFVGTFGRQDDLIRQTRGRFYPRFKRFVRQDCKRFEKTGIQISGIDHRLFAFAGVRHYQRPR